MSPARRWLRRSVPRHLYATTFLIFINGVERSSDVLKGTVEIEDLLNDVPDICRFVLGYKPTEGNSIIIYRGPGLTLEFSGTITKVDQYAVGQSLVLRWGCTAQDTTWRFNEGDPVTRRWSGPVSGTTIAQNIIATASGFSSSGVEASLPNLTDFEVVTLTRSEAMKKLCDALGGVDFKIGYDNVVSVFTVDATNLPDDITDATLSDDNAPLGISLVLTGDLGQIATRMIGKGKGSRASADIAAGFTSLPIDDASPASASGGTMLSGANVIDYTGKSSLDGQGGAVIGPLASPSTPSGAVSTTKSGGPLGTYKYWKTDVSADGESEPSAASSNVVPGTVATPGAISSGGVQHTAVGTYHSTPKDFFTSASLTLTRTGSSFTFTLANAVPGAYVRIFQSGTGGFDGIWPIASVSGSTCTVTGISTSAASSDTAYVSFITDGPLDGTFDYGISFVSAMGETAISAVKQVTAAIHAGIAVNSSSAFVPTTGGNMTSSVTYKYWLTVTSQNGESSPQEIIGDTATMGASDTAVDLTIPAGSIATAFQDLRVNGMNVYRSRASGSTPFQNRRFSREELSQGSYLDNSTNLTFTDTSADSTLGALPSNTPIGAAIGLWGITTTSDARCTGRRLWRKKGGVWYPLALLGDRDTTTFYIDTTPDSALGAGFTGADPRPFGGAAVNVTCPTGAGGTLSRNIYRSKDGGTLGFFCGSIPGNVTTAYEDTKFDEDLGREMVLTSQRTTLAGATAVRVPDLTKFPAGGWFRSGSQVGFFTGRSAGSGEGNLTGVPTSGIGAITAPIRAGAEIVVEPHITGISAVGAASIQWNINKGDSVRIYAVRNDAAAQALLAAAEGSGSTGIRVGKLDDENLATVTALNEALDASLENFALKHQGIRYQTRDPKTRSGKKVTVSLAAPRSISGSFLIQRVISKELDTSHGSEEIYPLRDVVAAPVLLGFRDVLRRRELSIQ